MSGRNPDDERKNSLMRKGIVGDWKNYFDAESRISTEKYAGCQLISLGYEKIQIGLMISNTHFMLSVLCFTR